MCLQASTNYVRRQKNMRYFTAKVDKRWKQILRNTTVWSMYYIATCIFDRWNNGIVKNLIVHHGRRYRHDCNSFKGRFKYTKFRWMQRWIFHGEYDIFREIQARISISIREIRKLISVGNKASSHYEWFLFRLMFLEKECPDFHLVWRWKYLLFIR